MNKEDKVRLQPPNLLNVQPLQLSPLPLYPLHLCPIYLHPLRLYHLSLHRVSPVADPQQFSSHHYTTTRRILVTHFLYRQRISFGLGGPSKPNYLLYKILIIRKLISYKT